MDPHSEGGMPAMRVRPGFDPAHPDVPGPTDAPAGGMPGGPMGDAPGSPGFGGRLAGLDLGDATGAGEMPRGAMNGPSGAEGAGAMPGADLAGANGGGGGGHANGGGRLDVEPPGAAAGMPDAGMDRGTHDPHVHAAMNAGRTGMPTGAMVGRGGAMPTAASLRGREDPDAGGEVRRHEDPDAGGELAAPADAGPAGMPTGHMRDTLPSPAAQGGDGRSGAAPPALSVGGEWRLTLSSISLGRG